MQPARTNIRSPITPCAVPMVATASPPIVASPSYDDQRADGAVGRQSFPQHDRSQQQARQRRAGRLDDPAVAERHKDEA